MFPVRHPEMILPLENVTILPYQDCKLNCLALSSGVLTYEWSKRDGSLPQNAVKSYTYETFFNSLGGETTLVYSLAIPYVQLSDEGWYCCIATNEAGSTTACTWLEVNGSLQMYAYAYSHATPDKATLIYLCTCVSCMYYPTNCGQLPAIIVH